jgi:hypothetical protein
MSDNDLTFITNGPNSKQCHQYHCKYDNLLHKFRSLIEHKLSEFAKFYEGKRRKNRFNIKICLTLPDNTIHSKFSF